MKKIPEIKLQLGQILKRKRLLKDLTRKALSIKMKVTPLQIFRWEQNKTVPDGIHLLLLMNELGIFPHDFFPPPSDLPTSDKLAAVQSPTPTESPPEIPTVPPVEVSQTIAKG